MQLISFTHRGRASFGIRRDDGIVDLGQRLAGRFADLAALVAGHGLQEARAFADAPSDIAIDAVRLEKPLDRWGKCFCVGVNYPERNAEYRDGSDGPKHPSLFVRFPESFVGPADDLIRPPESLQLDYEGEIVLVIGKGGRRIAARDWRDHVFGLTIADEGTIRDWVRHGKFNVTPGKNWAGSGAIGPWIVPLADCPAEPWRILTRVDGEVRQDDTTDRMMFSFGTIVEYVSTFCTLAPGDIILTGTPSGAGARFDPPRFLAPGNVVEVEVPGIGTLTNGIVDERMP